MNSSYGKSNNKSGSLNAFDFDLGLGSGRSKPMNDKRNQTPSYSSTTYAYSAAPQKPNTTSSWTHQPSISAQSGLNGPSSGPTSMVGDIFGKSWNSPAPPASSSASVVGIVNAKNPNLFSDLVNSAIGGNRSSSNVPLKNTAPVTSQNTFSMGSVANSLPKTGYSVNEASGSNANSSGGNVNLGGSHNKSSSFGGSNVNFGGSSVRNPSIGGAPMKSMAGGGVGDVGLSSSRDPFGSLVDFSSKPSASMKSASKASEKSGSGDDFFGGFQNATPNSSGTFPSSKNDPFGNFQNAFSKTRGNNDPLGDSFGDFQNASSKTGGSSFGDFQNASSKTGGSSFSSGAFSTSNNDPLGDFGFSSGVSNTQSQPQNQSSGANDFNTLFSSPAGGEAGGFSNQQFSGGDDWGMDAEFGGNEGGGTTELEGLPPPPAGVSASAAKNKGMDNYKQGQFADAIKWLSWAVILLEKAGDEDGTTEVLINRASCYKEVGEYKKAVADCTKVLDRDGKNVSVLVQRALLYESMEKYKLGAEDLRTVMNLDPGNRVARSTIHRLTKMAG